MEDVCMWVCMFVCVCVCEGMSALEKITFIIFFICNCACVDNHFLPFRLLVKLFSDIVYGTQILFCLYSESLSYSGCLLDVGVLTGLETTKFDFVPFKKNKNLDVPIHWCTSKNSLMPLRLPSIMTFHLFLSFFLSHTSILQPQLTSCTDKNIFVYKDDYLSENYFHSFSYSKLSLSSFEDPETVQ